MSEEIINNEEQPINEEQTLPEGVVKLTAEDGYLYTDPEHQIVGKTIYVVEDLKDTFIQVTEEEGNAIQEEIQKRNEKNAPEVKE